jgi:enamine deaminase RidA (YjgF/YER057c/UK114 family)
MRKPLRSWIIVSVAVAVASGAFAQTARVLEALRIKRLEAVHVGLDAGSPRGVVINQWTALIELQLVSSSTSGDLPEHAASVLEQLDERLASIGSSRAKVLKVNAFVGSEDAASAGKVADLLDAHFAAQPHGTGSASVKDFAPVIGMFVSDDGAYFGLGRTTRVVLYVTVLDPSTSTEDLRTDPSLDYRPDEPRSFMIGPIVAAGGGEEALRKAFHTVALLTREIGARTDDIEKVLVYGVYGRFDDAEVRSVAADFLDHLPLVDYMPPLVVIVAATPADATVAVEVTGVVTYQR